MNKRSLLWVVDDSAVVRQRMSEIILKQGGTEVVGYADPIQALRDLKEDRDRLPQIVFVDLVLPRMSGYSFIRLFRSSRHVEQTSVILLSRLDGPVLRLKARLAGANAYLPKPFTQEQVIEMVMRMRSAKLCPHYPPEGACLPSEWFPPGTCVDHPGDWRWPLPNGSLDARLTKEVLCEREETLRMDLEPLPLLINVQEELSSPCNRDRMSNTYYYVQKERVERKEL